MNILYQTTDYAASIHTNLDNLAENLVVSLISSQALFMSSLSFKTLIWYCFLTSSSFSFLRLNLSTLNFCADDLLLQNFPQLLQLPDSDQFHSKLPYKIVHRVYTNVIFYLLINPVVRFFSSGHAQVYLWMFQCENIVLLNTRIFMCRGF